MNRTAATGSPYFTSNIEDGIALLDARGRDAFAERYPDALGSDSKGVGTSWPTRSASGLKPEVLPFSNLQGYLPPFILSPRRVFAKG